MFLLANMSYMVTCDIALVSSGRAWDPTGPLYTDHNLARCPRRCNRYAPAQRCPVTCTSRVVLMAWSITVRWFLGRCALEEDVARDPPTTNCSRYLKNS